MKAMTRIILTGTTAIAFNFAALQSVMFAAQITTQDLFFIESIGIDSNGQSVQLIDDVITKSLESTGTEVTFPGGGVFKETTAFGNLFAVDANEIIITNTTVIPGVFSFDDSQVFSILVSSDVSDKKETLGISDSIEIDFDPIFPSDVGVGDGGAMTYGMVQLEKPSDITTEDGLSSLEIAVSRAGAGLLKIPSIDGENLLIGENLPFIVADGSRGWRYFGKGLQVCGAVITGGVMGGCAGAAAGGTIGAVAGGVPSGGIGAGLGALIGGGIGGVLGGIGGAVGGGLTEAGEAIERNNQDDDTPDPPPDDDLNPDSSKAKEVPEPLTILGSATALGFGALLKREYSKKSKKD